MSLLLHPLMATPFASMDGTSFPAVATPLGRVLVVAGSRGGYGATTFACGVAHVARAGGLSVDLVPAYDSIVRAGDSERVLAAIRGACQAGRDLTIVDSSPLADVVVRDLVKTLLGDGAWLLALAEHSTLGLDALRQGLATVSAQPDRTLMVLNPVEPRDVKPLQHVMMPLEAAGRFLGGAPQEAEIRRCPTLDPVRLGEAVAGTSIGALLRDAVSTVTTTLGCR